ncbi:MAG TPA: tripartite tricarboxylate transporter substrate binding protein [Vineibacter sp.]|nr:tripartite tricarboxylate transporter substrate binding protein [Vineibacter sp.]
MVNLLRRRPLMAGAAMALAARPVRAETFPSQTIRLVVGFSPGGGTDALARAVADKLRDNLGQTVIVDNKPGAGSNLAHEFVAKQPPDGYTLLIGSNTTMLFPFLVSRLGYDPNTAFTPIGFIAKQDSILVGSAKAPYADLRAIVQAARSTPGAVQYGTAGVATPMHLAAEQFGLVNKLKLTHVPFRGTGPMVSDLLGGHLELGVSSLTSVQQYFADGRLKPYAIAAMARSPSAPDVPTFRELGAGDIEGTIAYSLIAPAGVSPAIVRRLNEALNASVATPQMRDDLNKRGFDAMGGTPEELRQWLSGQAAIWGPVLQAAGVKPE